MTECSRCGLVKPRDEANFDRFCANFAEKLGCSVEDVHVEVSIAMGDAMHKSVCARLGVSEATEEEKARHRAAARKSGFTM
jgi:hypothetical protein